MIDMVGNMTPEDAVDLISDPRVRSTDVPKWIEIVLREKCKVLTDRLRIYERKITRKFGRPMSSLPKIIRVYHTIWENWDGQEPFPYLESRKLKYYFDERAVANQNRARN